MTTLDAAARVDRDFFDEHGYLVIEDVFDIETEIDAVVAEYTELLDRQAQQWYADGTISSTYEDLPFAQRFARVLVETGAPGFQPFDISLPSRGVTADTPMHAGPGVFALLTSPRLLDVVEQFVGGEILANPIQHVRIKPPERMLPNRMGASLLTASAWHQDQGVALPEVDDTNMLTVWIAVSDATVENGCLCVVPRSHRRGLITHCPGGQERPLAIPDRLVGDDVVPLPVRRGGIVLLHRQTMHSSLSNEGDGARWSFDLRYQPVGQPTGRPLYPSFVARSRTAPETAVTDWREWASLWEQARERVQTDGAAFAAPANRWDGSQPVCA
ncbi:phytanoyl-CoA dioxygenase family protein [Pseudonocardia sp. CA-107938]|uniref:phytanoyl-CoA dioxygenase family protein n=1 Tax=Pseudonocardia sp. CA-107938 TaxID=3240021 RepID=UPI003D8BB8BD